MRPHHTDTRNMSMLHPVRRLLLHLCKHISDNLGVLAGEVVWFLVAIARAHDGDEAELWPGQGVVEVVFQKVVLGEVCDVAGLDCGEEVDVGGVGGEGDDVDHFGGGRTLLLYIVRGCLFVDRGIGAR